MNISVYTTEKEINFNGQKYVIHKAVGFAYTRQFEFCESITELNNNSKATIVATLQSLFDVLPHDACYKNIFNNQQYFSTNYLGYFVTSNLDLFDNILEIIQPLETNCLFFISIDENQEIMKHIGHLQLC